MLGVGAELSRDELVRRLADVSNRTWIRQKALDEGVAEASLPVGVTEHDLERAEETVRELERLGVWPS
jgi:hypothetical protein